MSPEQHQRVMDLFNAAVQRPAPERASFLAGACDGDEALQTEVASLLAHDDSANSPVDAPILGPGLDVARFFDDFSRPEASLPQRIGPYSILGYLGSGGMGVVYRARQEATSQMVALKVMHPEALSANSRRRFRNEVDALACLKHPGIIRILDAGTETHSLGLQRPYIAMELVEGQPLVEYAAEHKLDVRARLELMLKVCDAVRHAHQRGVIHRDLKPANILVQQVDDGAQPRILDFGLAKLTNHDHQSITKSIQDERLLGTLAYMSPDQIASQPARTDTRSDVYSLGVICYELLSGCVPIDVRGMSLAVAVRAVHESEPIPLAKRDRRFRGDLSRIVTKAMAKDADRRYATAAELATDIRRYLANQPITARDPNPLYVIGKYLKRNRLRATLVALVLITVLGVGITAHLWSSEQKATKDLVALRQFLKDQIDTLVSDRAFSMRATVGMIDPRSELLQTARTYVEFLLAQTPDDAFLLDLYADVLMGQAEVHILKEDRDAAFLLLEKALPIREGLVKTAPDNNEYWADLSINLVKIGDIHNQRGDWQYAEQLFTTALEVDERLARADPASRRFVDNLFRSYTRMLWVALSTGRIEPAEDYRSKASSTLQRLVHIAPDHEATVHASWEMECALANLAKKQGETEAAETHLQRALEIAKSLVAQYKDNWVYMMDYIATQINWASLLAKKGELDIAGSLLDEVQTTAERLSELDVRSSRSLDLFSLAVQDRCDLHLQRNESNLAKPLADRAIELAQELLDQYPESRAYARRLFKAEQLALIIAQKLNLTDQVNPHRREMWRSLCMMIERPDPRPSDLADYASLLLSPPAPLLADPETARAAAQRAVDLSEGKVAKYWIALSDAYGRLGDTARVVECLEKARAVVSKDQSELLEPIDTRMVRLQIVPKGTRFDSDKKPASTLGRQ